VQDTFVQQEQGETLADRHSRAVRTAALWYQRRLKPVGGSKAPAVVLLVADTDARDQARAHGVQAYLAPEFAERYVKEQSVVDLVAWCGTAISADS
jgi:hypothetical protein